MEYTDILNCVSSGSAKNAELDLTTLAKALDEYLKPGPEDIVDKDLQELIDGVTEEDFAKCIAGAIKIYNTINNIDVDDTTVASQAQQAATLIKGIYDIASGEITTDDLIEKVVDMAECRLVANLDVMIDLGIEALPALVGAISPPLAPIATAVQPFLRQLAPKVKEVSGKVIHRLSDLVKEVGKETVQTAKDIVKEVLL